MQMKFLRHLSVLVPVAATVVAGCAQASASTSAVVATFKGGSVTQSEFNKYVNVLTVANPQMDASTKSAQTQILQQYIVVERILAPKAAKLGFQMKSAIVQQDEQQFKAQLAQASYNSSTQSLDAKMKSLHVSDSDITRVLGDQLAVEQYAGSMIPAAAVSTYYKSHRTSYTVTTQHGILVKTKAKAEMLYKLLTANHTSGEWNKLAKKYSQDPGSKNNGGVYANQPANGWVSQYAHAVVTQPLGEVGKPFHTTYGWFVVEVTKRNVESLRSVKTQVEAQMLNDSSSKYGSTINNLISKTQKQANIKVTLPSSSK